MTVEEVASLAKAFGWSYETLMSMSGAERRLWLAAARAAGGTAARVGVPEPAPIDRPGAAPVAPRPAPVDPWTAVGPMATEGERRARLLMLHEELNKRGRTRA